MTTVLEMSKQNFKKLQTIGILNKHGKLVFDEHLKLKADGYTDLSLNWLNEDEQYQYFAMTHYGELNGDLMSDPDMEVRVDAIKGTAEALSYRNDWVGVNTVILNPEQQTPKYRDLNEFFGIWTQNLIDQGFKHDLQE